MAILYYYYSIEVALLVVNYFSNRIEHPEIVKFCKRQAKMKIQKIQSQAYEILFCTLKHKISLEVNVRGHIMLFLYANIHNAALLGGDLWFMEPFCTCLFKRSRNLCGLVVAHRIPADFSQMTYGFVCVLPSYTFACSPHSFLLTVRDFILRRKSDFLIDLLVIFFFKFVLH